jgi:phosphoribosylanthranilate isomerase
VSRPLVKICGLTRVGDARAAVELGVDLVGLNFWPKSPRHVDLERARAIADAVRDRGALLVGVFVDEPLARVREVLATVGLDLAQLHGDEPAADHAALEGRSIRVFRGVPDGATAYRAPTVWGALVDVAAGARYGGTGESWNYAALAGWRGPRPLLVAGGIRPENAAAALRASGADGVDVASGVESAPGIKDRERMRRLIEEIRRVEKKAPTGR